MKKILLFTIIISLQATHAFASQCGGALPKYLVMGEDGLTEMYKYDIDSADQVMTELKYDGNEGMRIVLTANAELSDNEYSNSLVSLQDSIEALKENSEASDLKLVQFVYKKQYYTAVVYYPGGNMYGRIFYGNKIIAKVQDAEVICK